MPRLRIRKNASPLSVTASPGSTLMAEISRLQAFPCLHCGEQSQPPSETAHPWETVLSRDDFMPRLPEIKCPSLVIHGSADQAFDLATAKGLRDALPGCKGLVVIKGAAHAPNVTHPKPFNTALREFLESIK